MDPCCTVSARTRQNDFAEQGYHYDAVSTVSEVASLQHAVAAKSFSKAPFTVFVTGICLPRTVALEVTFATTVGELKLRLEQREVIPATSSLHLKANSGPLKDASATLAQLGVGPDSFFELKLPRLELELPPPANASLAETKITKPSRENNDDEPPAESFVTWYYMGHGQDDWQVMDKEFGEQVERSWNDNKEALCLVKLGKTMYSVDFQTLLQKNVATGRLRHIRRVERRFLPLDFVARVSVWFRIHSGAAAASKPDDDAHIVHHDDDKSLAPPPEPHKKFEPVFTLLQAQVERQQPMPYVTVETLTRHATVNECKVVTFLADAQALLFPYDTEADSARLVLEPFLLAGMCPLKLFKIINPRSYAFHLMAAAEICEATNSELSLVYHGTPAEHVASICRDSFVPELCVRHLYGFGSYFAKSPALAMQYTTAHHVFSRFIFVCSLAVGRTRVGKRQDTLETVPWSTCHTLVDKQDDPTMFVARLRHQACPLWLVCL